MAGAFVLLVRASKKKARLQAGKTGRQPAAGERQIMDWIASLQRADASFSLAGFNRRCRELFLAIQEGWFRRDLAKVRPFISDATFRRFQLQLKLLELQGTRNAIADYKVQQVALAAVTQSDGFDAVQVKITASMRDTNVAGTVGDDEARRAALAAPSQEFTEIWTFLRRRGAQTEASKAAAAGKCPNCGAPFEGGASNACGFCNAVINSGQHDWVLAEITQGVEFTARQTCPGQPAMRHLDPALSIDVLEDRASLLFFKWIEAQAIGDARLLAKFATPELVGQVDAHARAIADRGRHRVIGDCAVGGVNTLCFTSGSAGRIAAHVEVLWSARIAELEAPTAGLSGYPNAPRRHVLVLERSTTASSRPQHGLSTERCSSCNGLLGDGRTPGCEYCGAPLNDGQRDWVLCDILAFETWASRRPRALALPRAEIVDTQAVAAGAQVLDAEVVAEPTLGLRDRERLLYLLASVASADGTVCEQERNLLRDYCKQWSVSWVNLENALLRRATVDTGTVKPGSPEAEVVLRWLVQMARTDGVVGAGERALLDAIAERLKVQGKLAQYLA